MKFSKLFIALAALCTLCLASCKEENDDWDPYYDWQARNEAWFQLVADSARTAIAQARAQYGDQWEEHCEWRMYKSLLKSQDYNTGITADSVCARVITRGTGDYSPQYSDSIRLSFRGWLMDTQYETEDKEKYSQMSIFTQTYYGPFDPLTAAPSKSGIAAYVEGFSTILQYMVAGDDWMVYIPQQLAYGAKGKEAIPAYSTLLFRINLAGVYPLGTPVPDWK